MRPKEKGYERAICDAVAAVFEVRGDERLEFATSPEDDVRNAPAVEAVYRSGRAEYAMEHTLVESYEERTKEDHFVHRLLGPLETQLEGKLPGEFDLLVDTGAVFGIKNEAQVRENLRRWIEEVAPTIRSQDGESPGCGEVTDKPPGVPFECTLRRDFSEGSRLFIFRLTPEGLEELRHRRLLRAFEDKCGKLEEEAAKGRRTILILESNDIALTNNALVGKSFLRIAATLEWLPDHIFHVDTDTPPRWTMWILKDRDSIFPNVSPERYHYDADARRVWR